MADLEQVKRLKRSVKEWNRWRQEHPEVRPDLSDTDFRGANLSHAPFKAGYRCSDDGRLEYFQIHHTSRFRVKFNPKGASPEGANLSGADLKGTDFSYANLSNANLSHTDLYGTTFYGARLSDANLSHADAEQVSFGQANLNLAKLNNAALQEANFNDASLVGTNFSEANLWVASFNGANLRDADLNSADLGEVQFSHTSFVHTNLAHAYLAEARFAFATFGWVDLSRIKELEKAFHLGPSIVDIHSVVLPHDEPTRLHFLRGVGWTETQIEYLPSLLAPRPTEYASLFISYAHQDEAIAKRLYTDLRKKGVPCWFAPHDLQPGQLIFKGVNEAIHLHDKLLLILSQHAIVSSWVELEVHSALQKEKQSGQRVLFPLRLDNTVLESNAGWARMLQPRHIADFTNWQDDASYQQAFATLLRHLKVTRPPKV